MAKEKVTDEQMKKALETARKYGGYTPGATTETAPLKAKKKKQSLFQRFFSRRKAPTKTARTTQTEQKLKSSGLTDEEIKRMQNRYEK